MLKILMIIILVYNLLTFWMQFSTVVMIFSRESEYVFLRCCSQTLLKRHYNAAKLIMTLNITAKHFGRLWWSHTYWDFFFFLWSWWSQTCLDPLQGVLEDLSESLSISMNSVRPKWCHSPMLEVCVWDEVIAHCWGFYGSLKKP